MNRTLMDQKKEQLYQRLSALESLVVSFSGGVDSSLLLFMAGQVLGPGVLAVTARSPVHPDREIEEAIGFTAKYGLEHMVFDSDELALPEFTSNRPDRCYHCKRNLCLKLKEIARERGLITIAHGVNRDDYEDYRPGLRAAEEMGLIAPLAEAELTKVEIRHLSRELGLRVWDKPSLACLASRIPYGHVITPQNLKMVEEAEKVLAEYRFKHFRVRHHDQIARIEVQADEMKRFDNPDLKRDIIEKLRALGFLYITLDLEGYVTGSLNRALKTD